MNRGRIKNVFIASHYYPPHTGGLEFVARRQAMGLADQGYQVFVATCAHKKQAAGLTDDNGVAVYRSKSLNFFDDLFGIPFPIAGAGLFSKMREQIKKADIAHIHDIFYQTSWLAYVFARLQKKPVFLTQHVAIVNHTSPIVMAIQKAVYATWGRAIFRNSRAIIVYNVNVRNFLIGLGIDKNKIIELNNGIDHSVFHPAAAGEKEALRRGFGLPENKPQVLFVGRFVPKKGLDVLLEATSSEYDIVFAGSGTINEKWKSMPGTRFLGPLSQERLAELYRAVDIFVLPAQGEIFTLAMQEAMASGLPAITTDDPGYREYDIDRELIAFVSPKAPILKARIKIILGSAKLRERMSRYSIALSRQRFDWNRNMKNLLELYQNFD